ncbi:hypothetical protein HDU91_004928, partial [Kappamyces sp. JEL0680]
MFPRNLLYLALSSPALAQRYIVSDIVPSSEPVPGYVGIRFNQPMAIGATGGAGDNINEGVSSTASSTTARSDLLGLYARYEVFDPSSSQQDVVLDVTIAASNVVCPQYYKTSLQPINPGANSKCTKYYLCVLRAQAGLVASDDSVVTGISVSKGAQATVPSQLTWFADETNIHDGKGCGGSDGYYLTVQRGAAYPKDIRGLSFDDKAKLIRQYSPIISMHPNEAYWPSTISYFLDGTTRAFANGEWSLHAKTAVPSNLNAWNDPFWKGTADLSKVPVYAFWNEKGSGVVDVVFETLFPFNYGKKIPIALNTVFGNHVGDLEHTAVRFIDGVPAIFYSQYHSYSHYLYFKSPLLQKSGTNTKVWCAYGSHGYWTSPGTHQYASGGGGLVKLSDECAD